MTDKSPIASAYLDELQSGAFNFDMRLDVIEFIPSDHPALAEALENYFIQDDCTAVRVEGKNGVITAFDVGGKEV